MCLSFSIYLSIYLSICIFAPSYLAIYLFINLSIYRGKNIPGGPLDVGHLPGDIVGPHHLSTLRGVDNLCWFGYLFIYLFFVFILFLFRDLCWLSLI